MKTFIISIILLLAINLYSSAQNLITVQNGSKVQFYTSLDSAYVHSADGDTIYVPGGSYDVSKITIRKQLFIFGVGYNPDSTKATNFSYLTGTLTIDPGIKGGLLTGFALCRINLDAVSNYTLTRCNVGTIIFTPSGGSSLSSDNIFIENVIGYLDGGESTNNLFQNNIVGLFGNFSSNNMFNHNIVLGSYSTCGGGGSGSPEGNVSSSTIENNIIIGTISNDTRNCTINNNLFVNSNGSSNGSFYLTNGNIGSNNYIIGLGSLFVKYPANNSTAYNYSDDFHLMSNSPGKNAATDGSDIGIYGGQFSWQDGAIPINPHIQKNIVSTNTDAKGNLKVNITVEAQHH